MRTCNLQMGATTSLLAVLTRGAKTVIQANRTQALEVCSKWVCI